MSTPVSNSQQTQYTAITHALAEQGWHIQPDFLTKTRVRALKTEIDNLTDTQLTPAGIGEGHHHRITQHIRSDKTCWLTGQTEPQKNFLEKIEQLRQHLNRELYLGLCDYEAHYASYEPGARYHKHLDAFQNNNARKISTVIYLNENWQPEHGGELILYHPQNSAILQHILPIAGTLVTFISEKFPHEVMPAKIPRNSIAGWYRTHTSPFPQTKDQNPSNKNPQNKTTKTPGCPLDLHGKLESLIQREIDLAKSEKNTSHIFKTHTISDPKIIQLLYRASQAGEK